MQGRGQARSAQWLLIWLPFAVMGVVAVIDVLAGPRAGYLPLLTLGPAFASLSCGMRRTALVGVLALALCVALGFYDHVLDHRQYNLILAAIVGVTAASVLASAGRQHREHILADVRSVAEVAQQVLLRPMPRRIGPMQIAVSYTSAAAEARIGGDLYEVVSAPSGIRVIIGDVQGKVVTRPGRVGVREVVDVRDLGGARQHRVDVHLAAAPWHDLQLGQQRGRTGAAVGLGHSDDHVGATFTAPRRLAEHGVRLADPRCRAKVDL